VVSDGEAVVFKTGFSKVNAWRSCNKRYDFAYNRNLQAKRRQAAPLRGTILHEMLAARDNQHSAADVYGRYEDTYRHLFEEEREFYGEHFMSDIWRIYRGYVRTYKDNDWKVRATEGLVRTQLTPKIEFEGHYDLRVFSNGRQWLVDRKTHKTIPTAEERFNNFQLLLYVEAWNREHAKAEHVEGIIWDYLRTKAPTIPEVLKGGAALTRRANLDTDAYTYRKAIRDNGLDEDAYTPYLRELEKRSVDRFYQRVPLPVPSREMTDTVVQEFIQSAEMIRTAKHFPRNMTFACNRCEFFKLCNAELSGINAKFVERSDYEERDEDTRATEMD
jgi:PD-(D/E)XK nuclease superfamily